MKKIITSVGEDVEKLEPHKLLVEMYDGIAAWENNLAIPQKLKHRVTI